MFKRVVGLIVGCFISCASASAATMQIDGFLTQERNCEPIWSCTDTVFSTPLPFSVSFEIVPGERFFSDGTSEGYLATREGDNRLYQIGIVQFRPEGSFSIVTGDFGSPSTFGLRGYNLLETSFFDFSSRRTAGGFVTSVKLDGVVVAFVPDLDTWLCLILGFALIGIALRGRGGSRWARI